MSLSAWQNRHPRPPQDLRRYARHPRSQAATSSLSDGLYVYAVDSTGVVQVLPDGHHQHPKILGNAAPALYAGDLTIENGVVVDLTNLSGTFQFEDEAGLLLAALQLERQGLLIGTRAVRFFPPDGARPVVLR